MKKIVLISMASILFTNTFGQTNIFPSSGNVGIGTTTPSFPLTVLGEVEASHGFFVSGYNTTFNGQGEYMMWNLTDGTGETDFINNQGGGTGGFRWYNTPSGGTPLGNLMTLTGTGRLGIGTTSPVTNLQIDPDGTGGEILIGNSNTGSGSYTSLSMSISSYKNGHGVIQCISSSGSSYGNILLDPSGGNIGIGTSNPTDKLDIIAPNNGLSILSNSSSSYPYIKLGRTTADASIVVPGASGQWAVGAASGDFVLRTESTTNKIFLNNGGSSTGLVVDNNNVLIGKTSQTNSSYKLDVNGNIRASQVTVNATGADYVFDPSYHIRSIDSLSSYIRTYRHLPGISSAGQMQEKGNNLGVTQMNMLQNEEEMALYIINMNKKLKELEIQIKQLNAQMRELKSKHP